MNNFVGKYKPVSIWYPKGDEMKKAKAESRFLYIVCQKIER